MLIVKKGEPPFFPLWKGTCSTCKSEMRAKQEEVKRFNKWSLVGDIKCPVCKHLVLFYPLRDKLEPPGNIPG